MPDYADRRWRAEPIALVGALVEGRPNFMAAGFVAGVNHAPDIACVSLSKKHHTPKGIVENGAFSVNVPSVDYVAETDYCGLVSGRDAVKARTFFYDRLDNTYRAMGEVVCSGWSSGKSLIS
jgi:flavin reductase (DIM6/NTAB) family NADH-FMN oxidoreductase RutF